jgi:hypothetical protein
MLPVLPLLPLLLVLPFLVYPFLRLAEFLPVSCFLLPTLLGETLLPVCVFIRSHVFLGLCGFVVLILLILIFFALQRPLFLVAYVVIMFDVLILLYVFLQRALLIIVSSFLKLFWFPLVFFCSIPLVFVSPLQVEHQPIFSRFKLELVLVCVLIQLV